MLVLGPEQLKAAQELLKQAFPHSIKVYGCLFTINAGKSHNLEVVADAWPDFRAIICKPKQKGSPDREGEYNIYSVYSKDRDSLKRLLSSPGVLNWDTYTLLAGVDLRHIDAVEELATLNNVPSKVQLIMHVMMLKDSSQLPAPKSHPRSTLRPLTSADAELVSNSWKHGGNRNSLNSVLSYISNHPSLCVTVEGEAAPASWLLVYNHCALGLLFTRPEHRNRGYAKLLVSTMAPTLLQQGYPVYCFVEEGNEASYRVFKSQGFTEELRFRSVWFEVNSR